MLRLSQELSKQQKINNKNKQTNIKGEKTSWQRLRKLTQRKRESQKSYN
jgi:hypothetical protein